MLRIAIIVANKSEDIEVVVPADLWRRAGIFVRLISIEKKKNIILSNGSKLTCDDILSKENLSQYNAIYLPGGDGHFKFNDIDTPKLIAFLKKYEKTTSKTFMSLCASAEVYGKLGMLENVKATCYPGFESSFKKTYVNKDVVVSENFITGKAPGSAYAFALTAISKLLNKNAANKVAKEIFFSGKF